MAVNVVRVRGGRRHLASIHDAVQPYLQHAKLKQWRDLETLSMHVT